MDARKLLPANIQRKMRERLARHGIVVDTVVQRWTTIGELLDKLNKSLELERNEDPTAGLSHGNN
jgi:hypothetical protein